MYLINQLCMIFQPPAKQQLDKDWSINLNNDRLYRVKSRLETGKKLDKEAIEELLAAHGDTTAANHLNPNYVGAMLRGQIPGKESQDLKVYKKNQQFQNDGVAGFMIYKFLIKNEGT